LKVENVRTKLNTFVEFPLTRLDMSRHVEKPTTSGSPKNSTSFLYDLYAVCNHYGNLQGGHYTGGHCVLSVVCLHHRYYSQWQDLHSLKKCTSFETV